MWPTWNTIPIGWTHAIRVGLVCMVLCMSACTALSDSSSNPSGMPSEGESAGLKGSGTGGNGY
jgi:hypothetical protein